MNSDIKISAGERSAVGATVHHTRSGLAEEQNWSVCGGVATPDANSTNHN